MSDSKKRWSVTYTKHIKQKKKVYQDGFLHLNILTNNLLLFDDCQKLLECRLLKDHELVSPGETLSFHFYLVDVGERENGDSDFNSQPRRENKVHEEPRVIHRRKFKSPKVSSDNRKGHVEEFDARTRTNLSPSHKIIREFKKRELQRYGKRKCSPDTSNRSVTEWQVLYTTHLTQKAKKYHEGFLQLTNCGSFGREIHLYDACRKLLTSRFLKTDETLVSGETISLDGYLVEIGESEEDRKLKVDLNFQRSNCTNNGETKTRHAQDSKHQSNIYDRKEWQVMYTTQLTQKAKKYRDGFFRLENCGSIAQKILLYDSNRTLLDSRFLRKDEMIRYGESITFDAHLVDVGEPVENNKPKEGLKVKGRDFSVSGKTGKTKTLENCFEANKEGKSQNIPCLKQDIDSRKTSGIDRTTPGKITTTKPLRDVQQILAFLQKPVGNESISMSNSAETVVSPVSNAKGLEASEADKDFEECQTSGALPPNQGQSENLETKELNMAIHMGKTSVLNSSKVTSIFSSNDPDASNSKAKIHQSHLGNTEADTVNHDEAVASCIKEMRSAHTGDPPDDQTKSSVQGEMDEWPSFDLGF